MVNDLLLLSGNDIPFIQAAVSIHQPSIKEIAYIGEENFYTGCEMLTFSKAILNQEDRINLEHQSNFDILMSIIMNKDSGARRNRISMTMLLSLLFPDYSIQYFLKEISLRKEDEVHSINSENFENFKEIITAMFCLKSNAKNAETYNPAGDLARKIAEKLKKGRDTVNKQKGPQKIAVLSRYVSILAVGEQKDMNQLLNYTVYQLHDEFKRFEMKEEFDMLLKARLAGARDLKDVDDWRIDIHQ